MSSIPIDPKSDNPLGVCLTICPRCGGPAEELALTGYSIKYQCSCGRNHVTYAGQAHRMRCPCGNTYRKDRGQFSRLGKFKAGWGSSDKVLASQPCAECKKELAEHKRLVAEGGVYWKCSTCGSKGVIMGRSELAVDVRAQHVKLGHIKPPEEGQPHQPCGIDFEGSKLCPACHGQQQLDKEGTNDKD